MNAKRQLVKDLLEVGTLADAEHAVRIGRRVEVQDALDHKTLTRL